jgi:hypothetical protein
MEILIKVLQLPQAPIGNKGNWVGEQTRHMCLSNAYRKITSFINIDIFVIMLLQCGVYARTYSTVGEISWNIRIKGFPRGTLLQPTIKGGVSEWGQKRSNNNV